MLRYKLFFYALILTASLGAQEFSPRLQAGLHYTYMQHSQISGVCASTGLILGTKKHAINLGMEVNFGQGNPNVDISRLRRVESNLEYNGYVPPFQPLPGRSLTQEGMISFESFKTATAVQASAKAGYLFRGWAGRSVFQFGGGFYYTYVNHQYLVETIEGLKFTFFGTPFTADFAIPLVNRYLALGPYLSAAWQTGNDKRIPYGIKAAWQQGFEENSWLTVGVFVGLPF